MSKKFKVGDSVFAPMIGIGLIEERKQIHVAGLNLEVFEISYSNSSFRTRSFSANKQSVPVSKADTQLLPVATNIDLLKAFSVIVQPSLRQSMMWNRRSDQYQEALKSGDVIQIAKVYRDARKNGADEEALSYAERETRDEALACLAVQLAFNMDISRSHAAEFIMQIARGAIDLEAAKTAMEKGEIKLAEILPPPTTTEIIPDTVEAKIQEPAISRPKEARHHGGRKAKPIALKIDPSLIDFENIEKAQEKLEIAFRAFAGQPNLLVLWTISNLYKVEQRQAHLQEYISQRELQPQSLVPEKSRAGQIYKSYAEKEVLAAPETINPQSVKPSQSALAMPLSVILKMRMIDEETFCALQSAKRPPQTLGDIFHHVANDSWPEKASSSFGLDESRAEKVKKVLTKAVQDLSLMVK